MKSLGMSEWISVDEMFPEDGEEVTVYGWDCQVRQVVRDSKYSGGWKQPNCTGWECVSFSSGLITHWMRHKVVRPDGSGGPKDAPWHET